jgi:hypothetical protein
MKIIPIVFIIPRVACLVKADERPKKIRAIKGEKTDPLSVLVALAADSSEFVGDGDVTRLTQTQD